MILTKEELDHLDHLWSTALILTSKCNPVTNPIPDSFFDNISKGGNVIQKIRDEVFWCYVI